MHRLLPWAVGAIALAVGVVFGYLVAYTASLPDLAALGAIVYLLLAGAVILVTLIVGAIAQLWPHGRGKPVARSAFVAAGLLVVGIPAGAIGTQAFGLEYRAPVVLQAIGTASLQLDPDEGFVGRPASAADCRSLPDARKANEIVGYNLGQLQGRSLRAWLTIDGPYLQLWVDGAEIPEHEPQPTWEGPLTDIETAPDSRQGSASFSADLAPPPIAARLTDWPARLSGTLSWQCGEWAEAADGEPTALDATVTLDLAGVDWSPVADAPGSCELDGFGLATWLVANGVGRLQGIEVQIELDVAEGLRDGRRVHIWIALALPGRQLPPGADFMPNWAGWADVRELAADGHAGRVAFRDLPTGVDPEAGPPPAGWPATLTGELSWRCT